MPLPAAFERLRNARIVQPLVVYLGTAWVVLQMTETLIGLLNLPEWVGPTAVVLMLVGLGVVLATAWIQSLPQTSAAEEAGDVPSDWEVAPADVFASVRAGRLPHLNWARTILGGVVALSLLFGFAGTYVLVRGPIDLLGPAEAGAEGVASGIAVLPFTMTGADLDVYEEGMVNLMSANLDGLADYRAIDARTVLARWSREVGDGRTADLAAALQVARGAGARFAVIGSGTEVGSVIRFTANVYDLADGSKVGDEARAEGRSDAVLELVDGLSVRIARSLLGGGASTSTAQTFRLASLLTTSVPALRSFLEGDAHYRRGRFGAAQEALEAAVEQDSTFAMAWWRLGESFGWARSIGDPASREAKRRAVALADRLPPREASLLEISSAVSDNRAHTSLPALRAYLSRYPDDPDGWYLLGEVGLHAAVPAGVTDAEVQNALYRAVEQDPTFLPYYAHALEWAAAKGDRDWFMPMFAEFIRLGGTPDRVDRTRFRWDLLHGDSETRPAAVAASARLTQSEVIQRDQDILGFVDERIERVAPLKRANRNTLAVPVGPGQAVGLQSLYAAQGRVADLHALLGVNPTVTARAQYLGFATAPGAPRTEQTRAWVREALIDLSLTGSDASPAAIFAGMFGPLWLGDPVDFASMRARTTAAAETMISQIPPEAIDTTGLRAGVAGWIDAKELSARGDHEQAFQVLSKALAAGGGAFSGTGFFSFLGDEAVLSGRWDDAIRIFEGISRNGEERTWAKFRLGQAYEATGDTARALDAYRTFLIRTAGADPGWDSVDEARQGVTRLEPAAGN